MEDSSTAAVSDALSEITRKERRALLGVSTLCIAITHANLVPTKISALGIEADKLDQKGLLIVLALIVCYYIFAFAVYAFADMIVWRLRYDKVALEDTHKQRSQAIEETMDGGPNEDEAAMHLSSDKYREISNRFSSLHKERRRFVALAPAISRARAIFDFLLPFFVSIYSLYALLSFN